jgi:hypothetical protein
MDRSKITKLADGKYMLVVGTRTLVVSAHELDDIWLTVTNHLQFGDWS